MKKSYLYLALILAVATTTQTQDNGAELIIRYYQPQKHSFSLPAKLSPFLTGLGIGLFTYAGNNKKGDAIASGMITSCIVGTVLAMFKVDAYYNDPYHRAQALNKEVLTIVLKARNQAELFEKMDTHFSQYEFPRLRAHEYLLSLELEIDRLITQLALAERKEHNYQYNRVMDTLIGNKQAVTRASSYIKASSRWFVETKLSFLQKKAIKEEMDRKEMLKLQKEKLQLEREKLKAEREKLNAETNYIYHSMHHRTNH